MDSIASTRKTNRVNKQMAAGGEQTSKLFQVPIAEDVFRSFWAPVRQPKAAPMNCTAVTLQFLGLLDYLRSEALAAEGPRTSQEIVDHMNALYTGTSVEVVNIDRCEETERCLHELFENLFPSHGTVAGLSPADGSVGHLVVFARSNEDELVLIDPQEASEDGRPLAVAGDDDILAYMKRSGFMRIEMYVTKPTSMAEFDAAYKTATDAIPKYMDLSGDPKERLVGLCNAAAPVIRFPPIRKGGPLKRTPKRWIAPAPPAPAPGDDDVEMTSGRRRTRRHHTKKQRRRRGGRHRNTRKIR
jgi:hypothetical protein